MKFKIKSKYLLALGILLVSLGTHFAYWGYPKEVVFDEIHFGSFSSGYQDHRYYFDVHPPLGKLLLGAAGHLGGVRATESFTAIGQPYADSSYLYLRFLPSLAGALLPLILFFLCLEFGFSEPAAFFVGLAAVFENSLLANSRFILMDSLLLLFGFTGFLLYFLSSRQPRRGLRLVGWIAAAVFLAMSLSIKWTGATFLLLVLLVEFWRFLSRRYAFSFASLARSFLVFLCVPFAVYYFIMAIHFALLTRSGPGDVFMSINFQSSLAGNSFQGAAGVTPLNQWQKFLELNTVMYTANRDLAARHPDESTWIMWPFMQRPIFFWQGKPTGQAAEAKIYLLGNPFIYWLVLSAVAGLYLALADDVFSPKKRQRRRFKVGLFLAAGYAVNLLPFALIHRAMFLYHYFIALIFGIMALGWLIDRLRTPKAKWRTIIGLLALFAAAFIFFAPLTYGIPLDKAGQDMRFWFESWR